MPFSSDTLVFQLIINFAILSILSYAYYIALILKEGRFKVLSPFFIILPFSIVSWLCMQIPIEFLPGIIIDARVIVVALAGFCGGWVPGVITAVIVSFFRYVLGGVGVWPGIAVIAAAGIMGAVSHRGFSSDFKKLLLKLPLLGIVLAVTGLATIFLLPSDLIKPALKKMSLPVLISYPLGLTYAGMLLGVSAYRKKIRYRLKNSEQGFKDLFQYSPVSLWLEDFSEVYKKLQNYSYETLLKMEKSDPRLMEFFKNIHILDINKAVLILTKASSEKELMAHLGETMSEDSLDIFKQQLLAIKEGKISLQNYCKVKDLEGNAQSVQLSWFALNGPDEHYRRVLVSIVDITEQEKHKEHLDLLIRETHHRVSNNLNIISGMIDIERSRKQKNPEEKVLDAIQAKISSISLVHNQLYHSRDLHHVEVSEYISSIARQIIDLGDVEDRRISLELQCEPLKLPAEMALSCGLLINELVINAVKYAFPDNFTGTITVSVQKNNNLIVFQVADNGVGFSGWDRDNPGEGLGGSIIFALVDKLEGECRVLPQDRGFGVEISFSEDIQV